ncbi:Bystin-domain-containing protein [Dacryopinax primogenitus]|uniref:Bystin-domain-containing protein n=1 Tax=Dacryopinax primogenitus (strain DJM 731) TaxID=1858805 RepID=M5GH16_DACPD|nr:Bystin-domain-containing protein [Dacryopinax primogenitus]EJU06453.1 Bystin-domain-containing protein [Dacryopinax primogenitus]
MPRVQSKRHNPRHDPLHIQLREDANLETSGKVSLPGKRSKRRRNEDEDEVLAPASEANTGLTTEQTEFDPKTSRRILELAREQQGEVEEEQSEAEDFPPLGGPSKRQFNWAGARDDEGDESDVYGSDADFGEEYEELHIDAEDLHTLDALLPPETGARKTLADIILEKLEGAGEANQAPKKVRTQDPDSPPDPAAGVDPKIVDCYRKVGLLLRAKNPTLPKPFKIIPSHRDWARLLALTSPHDWSPMATFYATRILISNLKPDQARVYLEGILLELVRKDIRESADKKLNYHLYMSLKKAVFKPRAFFKGILFPLCEVGGYCNLREAAIIGSVLSKVSIPVLEASGALQRLSTMDYSGPNSLFIRILLDKKYELPYKVLDALVLNHFIPLANSRAHATEKNKLPVLWHQSLLVFVQRYANDLSQDQKDALLDVIRLQPHPQISPEIRRHLVESVARGEPRPPQEGDIDMDV